MDSQVELREQLSHLLNLQYKTNSFKHAHTFKQMIKICQLSLRKAILPTLYELNCYAIQKYNIKIDYFEQHPFAIEEQQFLQKLQKICTKIVLEPQYQNMNHANQFVNSNKIFGLKLNKKYARMQMQFKYVNLKEVMLFTALSQCNVWYTICKNRKKSTKQFDLDPLITFFNQFAQNHKFNNPFHLNILPKKQVKNIQRKINQQKTGNPLFEAVSNGNHNLVKSLLQNGAKIQFPSFLNNRQRTEVRCTHRACLSKDIKMCKILDSFNADWQAEDSEKMTPIFYAIQSGNMQIIKYLVEDIKVNIQKQQIQKRTPFYWACTIGDIQIIQYFYKAGCNINHKSQLGRTALSKSCYLGRRDIVLFLLGCPEIDMYSQCSKGRTALHNAVFGPKGGREGHKFGTNEKDSPQCAQIILEKGMNVDILDNQDCTSLHIATSSEAIDSIRLLLAYSASLTVKNNYGETPIMTGAKFGHVNACQILFQEYNADILCIDAFGKNLLLLTAKFQQNSDEQNGINPAFAYFLEPFFKKCIETNNISQLHRTFTQMLSSQFSLKMMQQMALLYKAFIKFKVPFPELKIQHVESILKISMNKGDEIQENFAINLLKQVQLEKQKLKEIHVWLINCNEPKILEFVHNNKLLHLNKIELTSEQFFNFIENQQPFLKEKVVSFCLLSLNFNWPSYKNNQSCNILHLLVRKQRSGCIVQLFKALSAKIPPKILTNKYLQDIDNKKVLQEMLEQKDVSGLDAFQLSLVLKNKAVAKLIQEKLKEQNFQFSSVLDVHEYIPIPQKNQQLLQKFNCGFDKQKELFEFYERIRNMNENQIKQFFSFEKQAKQKFNQMKNKQNADSFWLKAQQRKLNLIDNSQQLKLLQKLQLQKVIGIDLQYFNSQSITVISLLQLSSLSEDFIIDCLNIPLQQIKKYLQNILSNPMYLKIMHGADNDIILIRSSFNLCLINFVDTSRFDIDLRMKQYDLRGLATLTKQYLNLNMSKEYQVSEWRIRPVPKAMLQYARKDSMILPFLLSFMIERASQNLLTQLLLAGCKQVRRNKKSSQPLLKEINKK